MTWTLNDLPDRTGTSAVVTGANSGIGYPTALELARRGARVTLACRSAAKGAAAAERIRAELPGADVAAAVLDLSRSDSVAAFADAWQGPLDLLVNNAGVMAPLHRAETADGFELQFGTNHLGHFALTGRLLGALRAAPAPRVVTVSSLAHRSAAGDFPADAQSVRRYRAQMSYGNSKLANLLFALELQRRATAAGDNLASVAAHPGLASTNLVVNPDGIGGTRLFRLVAPLVVRLIAQSAADGALPTLYAASAAEPGTYIGPQSLRESRGLPGLATMSPQAVDPVRATRLWDLSEDLTGVHYDWSAAPLAGAG